MEVKPLAEITHEAIQILCAEIGVVNTLRFMSQFSTGYGNYTEDREGLFSDMTLEDMISAIKQKRSQTGSSG